MPKKKPKALRTLPIEYASEDAAGYQRWDVPCLHAGLNRILSSVPGVPIVCMNVIGDEVSLARPDGSMYARGVWHLKAWSRRHDDCAVLVTWRRTCDAFGHYSLLLFHDKGNEIRHMDSYRVDDEQREAVVAEILRDVGLAYAGSTRRRCGHRHALQRDDDDNCAVWCAFVYSLFSTSGWRDVCDFLNERYETQRSILKDFESETMDAPLVVRG